MLRRFLIFILFPLFLFGCGNDSSNEKLTATVRQTLSLLQENPQFVMYMSFKNMRQTDFWKTYVSDSIIKAESELGGMLNVFKNATDASISNGLDEIYISNSWEGENSFVLRGSFNKDKLKSYAESDTNLYKETFDDGITVYSHREKNLFFFLKDNGTICASNFPSRIKEMRDVKDTSQTGILKNPEVLSAIENSYFKNSFWLVSTESSFIRGIFSNFIESKSKSYPDTSSFEIDTNKIKSSGQDTVNKQDIMLRNLSKAVKSVCLSGKMSSDLKVTVQFGFPDETNALNFSKMLSGMIALSKLAASATKNENAPGMKIIENMKIDYEKNQTRIFLEITKDNIEAFRSYNFMNPPK